MSGKRCNSCKNSTFGLDLENHEGCTRCFCFGRSDRCSEAGFTWDQERGNDRVLTLLPFTSIQNVSFNIYTKRPFKHLHLQNVLSNDIDSVREIPSNFPDVSMESSSDAPLYWKLPPNFSGDLILSYGGYLRFATSTFGAAYPSENFESFPTVLLYGKETKLQSRFSYNNEVKLREEYWLEGKSGVSREKLMVVLQNVTKILIKATNAIYFENAT